MDPSTYGLQALRYWYDASTLPVLRLSTWGDAVSVYQKEGTFLTQFGKSVEGIDQSKVKSAMQKLGSKFGYLYPDKTDFFNYLASEAGTVSGSDIASAAGQGVLDAGKAVAKLATGTLIMYVAIAGIGIFILPKLLAAKKGAPA